jgi:beta-ribofuranosylaminobenzene 5'-phosphate synthase
MPGSQLPEKGGYLTVIEEKSGLISDAIKALLITDGSVTSLLECFAGGPVAIRTISQEVIPAPPDIAEEMDMCEGDPVNHRVVMIRDRDLDIPLIHAISYCPVNQLPEHARRSLMQADIPIGHILRDQKIESRREIRSIREVERDEWPQYCRTPGPQGRLFARKYQIIHQNKPLFRIEEFIPDNLFPGTGQVTIRTPSRLHLTLVDMNGSIGRVDGGIGITLDRPGFVIKAEKAEETRVIADDEPVKDRVLATIRHLSHVHGYDSGMSIRVLETIPFHNGLGSGTQLSLAVATAMKLLSADEDIHKDPALLTGRGGTSGIGVRAFSCGGVIVDGGHRFGPGFEKETFLPSSASPGIRPAPLIGRYEFPDDWRIILCLPDIGQGANGITEKNIFQRCCPVPLNEVQVLSHIILMQMIPSLSEQDLDQFGSAVTSLQRLGFKREEWGLQPQVIHDILDYMNICGTAGAGMSSFGPALYALTDTNGVCISRDIQSYLDERCGGEVRIVAGRNSGASIRRQG